MANTGSMALTGVMMEEPEQKPKRLTVREIEETFTDEIPDTPYRDLPPTFNETSERKRAEV